MLLQSRRVMRRLMQFVIEWKILSSRAQSGTSVE
jgi:hypothetical protein